MESERLGDFEPYLKQTFEVRVGLSRAQLLKELEGRDDVHFGGSVPPFFRSPASEAELLARARALAGRTLGEIAATHAFCLPPDLRGHKGVIGELLEIALGAGKPGGAQGRLAVAAQVRDVAAAGPACQRQAGRKLDALRTRQRKTGGPDRCGGNGRQGGVVGR